jgi:hypothetical protein
MPPLVSPERAEILGLNALAWLAGEPDALAQFLKLSGISGKDLRDAAGSTGLTIAVMDFLLAHENLLLVFCEASGTGAAELLTARRVLEPEHGI